MARNTFQDVILPLLCEDTFKVIRWLQQKKVLKSEVQCDTCSNWMNWTKYSRSKDGFLWKCQFKECQKYKSTKSIRMGSFFARSNFSLQKGLEKQRQAVKWTLVKKRWSTVIVFFREICTGYFQTNPVQLGGPGITVEIDESCFSHKPKHHRRRPPNTSIWVFGIVDTSTSPAVGYMKIVERRDAASLLPILQKVVRQGSVIHSDG